MTKSEQWALIATIVVVCGGFWYQARGTGADATVWIEEGEGWEAVRGFDGNPAESPPATAPTSVGASAEVPKAPSYSDATDAAIDIDTASREELQRLSGIGPSKANAIVEHRESVGGFKSVDQLVDVPGIGEKTLERLRPYIKTEARKKTQPGSSDRTEAPSKAADLVKVNLNLASEAELMNLNGIGPALARRIVVRRKAAPFCRIEELMDVKGIGPKTFANLKDDIIAR